MFTLDLPWLGRLVQMLRPENTASCNHFTHGYTLLGCCAPKIPTVSQKYDDVCFIQRLCSLTHQKSRRETTQYKQVKQTTNYPEQNHDQEQLITHKPTTNNTSKRKCKSTTTATTTTTTATGTATRRTTSAAEHLHLPCRAVPPFPKLLPPPQKTKKIHLKLQQDTS